MNKNIALFYYQLLASCRVYESVFFTIVLSPVLFLIFGFAFHIDSEYAEFFLPGIIGSMVCSDALYAVGPVIKKYYSLNIIKYFYNYPVKLYQLFAGFIFSRLLFVAISMSLLIFLSYTVFDYAPNLDKMCNYLIGILFLYVTYSFIGLTISFWGIHDNKDQSIIGIYYMLTIFLSDAFFVLTKLNTFFDILGYLFPLRVVLDFMRGNNISMLYCCLWLSLQFIIFLNIIKRIHFKR